MLTGSLAMSFYAVPRMTRDIDLVVDLNRQDVDRVWSLFHQDYYVSREAVASALAGEGMFNLIHQESVIKVDCIVRKRAPYRLAEFHRRQRARIAEDELWVVSKEDLILSKLAWAKDSRSETQLGDVRRLLASGSDDGYLNRWGAELGVTELLEECRHE